MRIGTSSIVRNYTTNLNRNLGQLNQYSNRISTQRRFASMAEDASSGIRAMELRRSIANTESYMDTAKTVHSTFQAAEDQMMKISDLGKEIASNYTKALNGDNTETELAALKNSITQMRDQILACANSQFAGNHMFGGTNSGSQPFTLDDSGELLYNGVMVKDISKNDPAYAYLFSDASYVDIGKGIKSDASGNVIPTTAFKGTLNGLDFLGCGDDNIYRICNEMITALEDPAFHNGEPYDELLNRMHTAYNEVTLEVTNLGSNASYLSDTVDRFETELINMYDRQNSLEAIDPSEAIIDMKMQEFIYNATLQMGQRLLQPTLFNFIN